MRWAVAPDAEKSLIGSIVGRPDCLPEVEKLVSAQSFTSEDHRAIFIGMQQLWRSGIQPDIVNLTQHFYEQGREDLNQAIFALLALTPVSIFALDYAKTVRKAEEARRVADLGTRIQTLAHPSLKHLSSLLEEFDREMASGVDPDTRLHVLASMLDVEEEEIEWRWYPWIPVGKVSLLEGDPGLGKSILTCVIAAARSKGWPLPGQARDGVAPGRVLILADEDGLGDTVRPRLRALGADLSMIRPVLGLLQKDEESALTLDEEGMAALDREIEAFGPEIVIIDPLFAYLPGSVDINNGREVRAALRPLGHMCQRHSTSVIALRHLNKAVGSAAQYRGQGNIDFFALARSVMAVREDPDDTTRMVLVQTKSNLAGKAKPLAFRIGTGGDGVEFLWEGQVDMSEGELFAPHDEDKNAVDEARRFLQEVLFEGAILGREVQKAARDAGIAERTLWRAKSKMKVKAVKRGDGWYWEMPLKEESPETLGRVGRVGSLPMPEPKMNPANPDDAGRVGRLDDLSCGATLPTLPADSEAGRVDFPHADAKAANSANSAKGSEENGEELF